MVDSRISKVCQFIVVAKKASHACLITSFWWPLSWHPQMNPIEIAQKKCCNVPWWAWCSTSTWRSSGVKFNNPGKPDSSMIRSLYRSKTLKCMNFNRSLQPFLYLKIPHVALKTTCLTWQWTAMIQWHCVTVDCFFKTEIQGSWNIDLYTSGGCEIHFQTSICTIKSTWVNYLCVNCSATPTHFQQFSKVYCQAHVWVCGCWFCSFVC